MLPRGRNILLRMKRYAELQRIESVEFMDKKP